MTGDIMLAAGLLLVLALVLIGQVVADVRRERREESGR